MSELCRVCDKPQRSKKLRLCNAHTLMWKRHRRLRRVVAPKGSGTTTSHGYKLITVGGKQVYEHVEVAKNILGYTPGYIYHLDGDKKNNNPSNLIGFLTAADARNMESEVCAFMATGDKNNRRCFRCGNFDSQKNMYMYASDSKKGVRFCHAIENGACVKTCEEERRLRSNGGRPKSAETILRASKSSETL